jgi:osmotically-inducible protein OsmY
LISTFRPWDTIRADGEEEISSGTNSTEVGRQIQERQHNLAVKADDKSVTLTGTVDTQRQHDLALSIAQSHAGDRKVVDQIKIKG